MNNEDLEFYAKETLSFDTLDEAFDDFVYDMSEADIIDLLTDEMKETILSWSPSYVKKDNKWYFNGEFQEIDGEEIDKIIELKESDL